MEIKHKIFRLSAEAATDTHPSGLAIVVVNECANVELVPVFVFGEGVRAGNQRVKYRDAENRWEHVHAPGHRIKPGMDAWLSQSFGHHLIPRHHLPIRTSLLKYLSIKALLERCHQRRMACMIYYWQWRADRAALGLGGAP